VVARARELGCDAPSGVALLPGNFSSAASRTKFLYHEMVPQVRQAWRGMGLIDTGPGRAMCPAEHSSREKYGLQVPIAVYFDTNLPSADARPVFYALGMIASVLSANRRPSGAQVIRVDAVVQRPYSGGYTCLEFSGDSYELTLLARAVREILGDASFLEEAVE
jgi:hypothetical protein